MADGTWAPSRCWRSRSCPSRSRPTPPAGRPQSELARTHRNCFRDRYGIECPEWHRQERWCGQRTRCTTSFPGRRREPSGRRPGRAIVLEKPVQLRASDRMGERWSAEGCTTSFLGRRAEPHGRWPGRANVRQKCDRLKLDGLLKPRHQRLPNPFFARPPQPQNLKKTKHYLKTELPIMAP
ncbi:hypothetical protein Enr13x_56150 [Stieleria neptunia]|uniref:Uncharacterized protein n=1 Tax=Stieleria neptunia TaxID=2527979 RepID=A0A518HXZ3_9BACT|nr:hypothetical protein Enr13x_56150 [Stieleria neptunia]